MSFLERFSQRQVGFIVCLLSAAAFAFLVGFRLGPAVENATLVLNTCFDRPPEAFSEVCKDARIYDYRAQRAMIATLISAIGFVTGLAIVLFSFRGRKD